MITDKFNYTPIPRKQVNGKRLYETPTGDKVASVTTILDKTKSEESRQALQEWRKRVGTAKAQQITTEAANRGTRMHTYLEKYILNDEFPPRGTNPFSWPSHDMAQVVVQEGLAKVDEYWGTEVPLYFPQIYAGTTDLVGIHDGDESIMDFKQANKPKKTEWIEDYFIQLTAYGEAHNEIYGTNIRKGVIMMCVRPTEKAPGVYSEPPKYMEWILEGDDWDRWRNKWWQRVEEYYIHHK